MKRVIPILVITVWLLQAVTINVNAAPFHLSPALQTDPVVDLEGETPVVVDITNEMDASQIVSEEYVVTGDGTPMLVVTGTAVSYCYQYFGASFCTGANFDVTVKNNNGALMTLNACASAALSDTLDGHNNIGTAHLFWEPDDWDGLGNPTATPFNDCVQYELEDEQIFTVGIRAAKSNIGPDAVELHSDEEFTWTFKLYLSYAPLSTCAQDASIPLTTDIFPLDPTIETPDGITDEQVFPVTAGNAYSVTTEGYWTDRTTKDHHDIAVMVSWDGELWVPAFCMSNDADGKTTLYFIAESETLYIRVSSQPGAINWETNTATDPYTYTVSAIVFFSASCESQYAYDSFDDLVGFVGVISTNEDGVLANNADIPLVVGDWYVVRWNYGEWMEGGLSHKDLQYKMALNWEPLSEGSGSVWCVSTSGIEVLIQASAVDLYLRVNDQDDNFANNTGTPYYDLYHVTFTRAPEMCETSIVLGDLIEHKTVNGNQSGGVPFAQMVGGSIASIGLEPGGIYVVDTVEGPWWQVATNPFNRYDLAVTEDASTWVPLEEWTRPTCNVATDALGHRRVIFQMPSAGEITYSMRVNATGAFFLNQGAMSWDLYGARSASEPVNTCFDGWSFQPLNEFEWLDVRAEGGEILTPDSARYEEYNGNIINGAGDSVYIDGGLVGGVTYAVETPAGQGPWYSSPERVTHWDIALSSDNGATWFSYDESNTPVDCYSINDIDHTIKIKFIMQEGQVWKIRVNDTNENFGDNTGNMAYKFYALCEGMSCTASIPNDSTTGDGTYSGVNAGGNVCSAAIVRPAPFTLSELTDLGNYFGAWFQYASLGIFRYMAWCQVHTNKLMAFLNEFKTVEPLATVYEWIENFKRLRTQISSYNWGDRGGQDFSLFNVRSSSEEMSLPQTRSTRHDPIRCCFQMEKHSH